MIVRRRSLCQNVRVRCGPRRVHRTGRSGPDRWRGGHVGSFRRGKIGGAVGSTVSRRGPRRVIRLVARRSVAGGCRAARLVGGGALVCSNGSESVDPRSRPRHAPAIVHPADLTRTGHAGRPATTPSSASQRVGGVTAVHVPRPLPRPARARDRWNRCRNAAPSPAGSARRAGRRSSRPALLAGSCLIDGRRQRATVCRRAAHNPNAGLRHLRARPPRRFGTRSRAGVGVRTSAAPAAAWQYARRADRNRWRHPRPCGRLNGEDRCRVRCLRVRALASAGSGRTGAPHLDPHPGGRALNVRLVDGPPSDGGTRRALQRLPWTCSWPARHFPGAAGPKHPCSLIFRPGSTGPLPNPLGPPAVASRTE